MAKPTKEQRQVLDKKLVTIQTRINRAGRAKKAINLGVSSGQ